MSDRERLKKEIDEAVTKIEERLKVAKQALLDIDSAEEAMLYEIRCGAIEEAEESKHDVEKHIKEALSAFEDVTIHADSCFEEYLPQLEKDIVGEFETANY